MTAPSRAVSGPAASPSRLASRICSLLVLATATTAGAIGAQSFEQRERQQMARYAKRVCSEFFLAGRDVADILEDDLDTNEASLNVRVRRGQRIVEVSSLTDIEAAAIYRPGLGCTLLGELSPKQMQRQAVGAPVASELRPDRTWPLGSAPGVARRAEVDAATLRSALTEAFSENGRVASRGTRAVAVVYDGQLIAERYAPGFRSDQPMRVGGLGSGILNALYGVLSSQGTVRITDGVPLREWSGNADERRSITYDHLLRMTSGLPEFEEARIDRMLLTTSDLAAATARASLETPPGQEWRLSVANTIVLGRLLRSALGDDLAAAANFPRQQLFEPLGMSRTTLEPDAEGTFVASHWVYSSARDLARLGQLFLDDGVWQGRRLLSESWVDYATTPTAASPQGIYGAHWWLNAGLSSDPSSRLWPSLPPDAFGLLGAEGQNLIVIPSYRAVIVRLGRTLTPGAWDLDSFAASVLAALPAPPEPELPADPAASPAEEAPAAEPPAATPEPPPQPAAEEPAVPPGEAPADAPAETPAETPTEAVVTEQDPPRDGVARG